MTAFDLSALRHLDEAHHLHPFTDQRAMHKAGTHVIRSAHGSTLVDEDGREILDGLAGLWCTNVGYGRTEITDAIHAAAQIELAVLRESRSLRILRGRDESRRTEADPRPRKESRPRY